MNKTILAAMLMAAFAVSGCAQNIETPVVAEEIKPKSVNTECGSTNCSENKVNALLDELF